MRHNATNTSHDAQSPRFEIDYAPLHGYAQKHRYPAIVENKSPDREQLEDLATPDLVEPVVTQPQDGQRDGLITFQVSCSSICS